MAKQTQLEELIASVENQHRAIEKIIKIIHEHKLNTDQVIWIMEYLLRIANKVKEQKP